MLAALSLAKVMVAFCLPSPSGETSMLEIEPQKEKKSDARDGRCDEGQLEEASGGEGDTGWAYSPSMDFFAVVDEMLVTVTVVDMLGELKTRSCVIGCKGKGRRGSVGLLSSISGLHRQSAHSTANSTRSESHSPANRCAATSVTSSALDDNAVVILALITTTTARQEEKR